MSEQQPILKSPIDNPTPPTIDELWQFYENMGQASLLAPVPIFYNLVHPDAKPLEKSRDFDMGWDVFCVPDDTWFTDSEGVSTKTLMPGQGHTFDTGMIVATPPLYGFIARERSSLGMKDLAIRAGVIEGTYRNPWGIRLYNMGNNHHTFQVGDKIAQVLLTAIPAGVLEERNELPASDRGTKGWGSSGR